MLAFFGELNALSNFHKCEFEYTGITFHSSEQMIQYMKAIFFEDTASAEAILRCDTAVECKRLARNIKGYNNDTWTKCAREMCEGGIYQKFKQNEELADVLLSTKGLKLVESSKDKTWGTGIHLHDDRALVQDTWYYQGILGSILEEVRSELDDIKGCNDAIDNQPVAEEAAMELASDET